MLYSSPKMVLDYFTFYAKITQYNVGEKKKALAHEFYALIMGDNFTKRKLNTIRNLHINNIASFSTNRKKPPEI